MIGIAKTFTAGIALITTAAAGIPSKAVAEEAIKALTKEVSPIALKLEQDTLSLFNRLQLQTLSSYKIPEFKLEKPDVIILPTHDSGLFACPDKEYGDIVLIKDSGDVFVLNTGDKDPVKASRMATDTIPGLAPTGTDSVVKADKVIYHGISVDAMMPEGFELDKNSSEKLGSIFKRLRSKETGLKINLGGKSGENYLSSAAKINFSTGNIPIVKGFTENIQIDATYGKIHTETTDVPEIQYLGNIDTIEKTVNAVKKDPRALLNSNVNAVLSRLISPEIVSPVSKKMDYELVGGSVHAITKSPDMFKTDFTKLNRFIDLYAEGAGLTGKGASSIGEQYNISSLDGDYSFGGNTGFTAKIGNERQNIGATLFGGHRWEMNSGIKGTEIAGQGIQDGRLYGGELTGTINRNLESSHELTLSANASRIRVDMPGAYKVDSEIAGAEGSIEKGKDRIKAYTQHTNSEIIFPELGGHRETNTLVGAGYERKIGEKTSVGVDCNKSGKDISCFSVLNWKF